LFICCDAHRNYSVFVSIDEQGKMGTPVRVEQEREHLRMSLRHLQAGTDVAVEATGSW